MGSKTVDETVAWMVGHLVAYWDAKMVVKSVCVMVVMRVV